MVTVFCKLLIHLCLFLYTFVGFFSFSVYLLVVLCLSAALFPCDRSETGCQIYLKTLSFQLRFQEFKYFRFLNKSTIVEIYIDVENSV